MSGLFCELVLQAGVVLFCLSGALNYCSDIRGFLKYGGSYWLRMRRLEAWRSKREAI